MAHQLRRHTHRLRRRLRGHPSCQQGQGNDAETNYPQPACCAFVSLCEYFCICCFTPNSNSFSGGTLRPQAVLLALRDIFLCVWP